MPIAPPPAPRGLVDAVLRTAGDLLPGRLQNTRHGIALLAGGGGEPEAGPPRPLYHLGLDRLVDGSGLSAAEQVGWRTMVSLGGSDVAIADSTLEVEDSTVRSMNYGPFVGGLERVHRMVGDRAAPGLRRDVVEQDGPALDSAADLEERVLQVPGVYFVGVWLHDETDAGNDTIVPAAPAPQGLAPEQTYRAEDVVRILTRLAQERLSIDDAAQEEPPSR